MGELGERRWAVTSERGCEASSLSYMEAVEMMRSLAALKVSGLCIITNEAAKHLPPVKADGPAQLGPQPAEPRGRS
ncbi:MAG TPA: hypothetical protein VF544_23580 [Pyrinomonadaceae bacterium]|jgi:hypothetical protein